jgi:ABC-2 type transport system permease protein
MGLLFFIVYSFTLFGLRSEAISAIVLQLLTMAEKPDTVFPKIVRNLLIYAIPIFLFSAIPARIALGKSNVYESIWCYSSPLLYYLVLKVILYQGLKKYQSTGGEI